MAVERRVQGAEFSEIVASGGSVCSVARRHGLWPQQLFGWCCQFRGAAGGLSKTEEVQFVPAVVDAVVQASALGCERKRHAARQKQSPASSRSQLTGLRSAPVVMRIRR